MATTIPVSSLPSFPSVVEESKDDQVSRLLVRYKDLMPTFPQAIGWHVPLKYYLGFWISEILLPGVMAMQQDFIFRPTDVLLGTLPKCGTTWFKALIFAVTNRGLHHPSSHQHPLLNMNPHDCIRVIVYEIERGLGSHLDALPPPRLLHTHVPYSLLPPSAADSGCRIIYVCRDPKDALVSAWHFFWGVRLSPVKETREQPPFSKVLELGCQGISVNGPLWDHFLEYWRESLRRPDKVLFLQYEEMMEDPVGNLRRMAEFLGCPFSGDEERGGVLEEITRLCSFEKMSSLEVNKTGEITANSGLSVKNCSFFRKGKIGDWVNHMTVEMAQRLDGITHHKLKGSGLVLAAAAANQNTKTNEFSQTPR